MTTFASVLGAADELDIEDQRMLVDILTKRLAEHGRELVAEDCHQMTVAEITLEATQRYTVNLYHNEDGISVSAPALPGCWSEGDTEAEALENIRDAIQEYVAALNDRAGGTKLREVEV